MTTQILADGVVAYSNLVPEYAMQSALLEETLGKGGLLTLTILPGHPAYGRFAAYRTCVEIYREGRRTWRGRPLPHTDALYGVRTIPCEGELCFFNDVHLRPYLYQADPETIFRDIVAKYNAVVEPWKRFVVGTVTVTDPNDYVRMENENPSQAFDALQKLVDRCGGYILFEESPEGRTINWYAEIPYISNQSASFRRNITDYIKQPSMETYCTRVIPYGAKQENGTRLMINVDGKDYVQDDDAVALRGVIESSVIFDDITLPDNLFRRATSWLHDTVSIPYSTQISAIDLSKMDGNIDAFAIGQRILTENPDGSENGYLTIISKSEDLCDPRVGGITLGRMATSLIGAERQQQTEQAQAIEVMGREAKQAAENVAVDLRVQITQAVQSSQAVIFSALEEYSKTSDLEALKQTMSAQLAVMADQIYIDVSRVTEQYEAADGILRAQIEEIAAHYRFTDNGQYIGLDGSDAVMRLFNDILQIIVSGVVSTQVDRDGLTAERANIRMLNMGPYTWKYNDTDGHLALM